MKGEQRVCWKWGQITTNKKQPFPFEGDNETQKEARYYSDSHCSPRKTPSSQVCIQPNTPHTLCFIIWVKSTKIYAKQVVSTKWNHPINLNVMKYSPDELHALPTPSFEVHTISQSTKLPKWEVKITVFPHCLPSAHEPNAVCRQGYVVNPMVG